LEVDGRMVEQVMKFNYLGVNINNSRNLVKEIKIQTQKAARVAGCLNYLVWRNKYIRKETKSNIYKTTVRSIMTYALETRGEI
jgi:hypothetical protein